MKPLKELISEASLEHDNHVFRMEPHLEITHANSFEEGAKYVLGYFEELAKSAGEFDEISAHEAFNPMDAQHEFLMDEFSFKEGAKWQLERDKLIIQSLRLRIGELEGTIKPLKEQVPSA